MDDDFDYDPVPTWRERAAAMFYRWLPYAVGIAVLCACLILVCSIAARVDSPHGGDMWHSALDAASMDLKNGPGGQ